MIDRHTSSSLSIFSGSDDDDDGGAQHQQNVFLKSQIFRVARAFPAIIDAAFQTKLSTSWRFGCTCITLLRQRVGAAKRSTGSNWKRLLNGLAFLNTPAAFAYRLFRGHKCGTAS